MSPSISAPMALGGAQVTSLSCLQSLCILPLSLYLALSPCLVSLNQDIACPFLFTAASLPPIQPLPLLVLALFSSAFFTLLPPQICSSSPSRLDRRLQLYMFFFKTLFNALNLCLLFFVYSLEQDRTQGHAKEWSVRRMQTMMKG